MGMQKGGGGSESGMRVGNVTSCKQSRAGETPVLACAEPWAKRGGPHGGTSTKLSGPVQGGRAQGVNTPNLR